MKSPIKYYSGKSYMVNIILNQFPKDYKIYVEGFGGGASVLFAKPQTGIEIYNDLGDNVYALFKVLSDKAMFERLKERIDLTPYSSQLRSEYKDALMSELSMEDRAYYYLYVNRSSFNGVGGFSVNTVVRRNMSKSISDYLSMVDKLPEIHNRLSSVIVEHRDIFDLIDHYDKADVFMYLDPPYVHNTRLSTTRYEQEMTDEEHARLVARLLQCKCKWLLSGYDTPIYQLLTDKYGRHDYTQPGTKVDAVESLWRNYES